MYNLPKYEYNENIQTISLAEVLSAGYKVTPADATIEKNGTTYQKTNLFFKGNQIPCAYVWTSSYELKQYQLLNQK